MSKFTTEVRYICEYYAEKEESVGYSEIDTVIDAASPKIFDNYEIFDENYRAVLNKKILRHYYMREICAETLPLWKLWLNNRMNEIMPYYNQVYRSAVLEFNPLYDVDLTTSHTKDTAGISNSNTKEKNETSSERNGSRIADDKSKSKDSNNNTHWKLFSDTPQGGVGNFDENPEIEDNMFLTDATKDTDGGTTTSNRVNSSAENSNESGSSTNERNNVGSTAVTNTEDYVEKVQGKRGGVTYSAMLLEFRKTLINIDKMIIDELSDLFFTLYE